MLKVQEVNVINEKVLQKAYQMFVSKNINMSFNDDEDLYTLLATWKNRFLGKKSHHIYTYFNFPLAFLLLGLLDQYESANKKDALAKVERKVIDLVTNEG